MPELLRLASRKVTKMSKTTELTAVRDGAGWRFDAGNPTGPDDQAATPAGPVDDGGRAATTAAAIPTKPPAGWFADPGLGEPTALTVTADGRVYGHAAAWGVRHIGLPGCRTAPRSSSGYRYYRTGQVECDDGSLVATGRITMGAGHAELDGSLTAASDHYDNVCSAVADVACGEDTYGIWYAGALRPEVTPEQVRTLRASSLSGDWRPAGRDLEMVGLLAVNVAGFPTPRAALAASGDQVQALVAAGAVVAAPPPPPPAPSGPPPGDGPTVPDGIEQGTRVKLGEWPGMVTEVADDQITVEVVVPADALEPMPEDDPVAASAVVRSLSERLERAETQLADARADKLLGGIPAE